MQQGQVFILAVEAGSSLLRNRTMFVSVINMKELPYPLF